jgi:hypothetical protein
MFVVAALAALSSALVVGALSAFGSGHGHGNGHELTTGEDNPHFGTESEHLAP